MVITYRFQVSDINTGMSIANIAVTVKFAGYYWTSGTTDADGNVSISPPYAGEGFGVNPGGSGHNDAFETIWRMEPMNRDFYPVNLHRVAPPPTNVIVTVQTTTGGSTTPPPGAYTVPKGQIITVTAGPVSGYKFSHWETDITGIAPTDNPVSFPAADGTITAYFEPLTPITATLTISVVGEGSTNPLPGTLERLVGSTLYITANPALGWRLKVMRRNGLDHTRMNPGQFLNVQDGEHIEVVFEQETRLAPSVNVGLVVGGLVLAGTVGYAVYRWLFK